MSTIVDNIDDVLELPYEGNLISQERLVNEFARITQYATWPFIFLLFHFFYRLDIQGQENFRLMKRPFLIISNHVDYYHSFAFRLVLGAITPNLPLRFMAVTKFDWSSLNFLASIGVVDFIYSLFGVFTVTPGLGIDHNIKKAKDIIKAEGNIVIYPEGKINTLGGVGPFKKGAAVLVKEMGVKAIPVAFRLGKRCMWWRELDIRVGKPIAVSRNESVEKITEQFRGEVVRLYEGK